MNFKDMNLLELGEFWNKDWKKESAELDNPDTLNLWEMAVNAALSKSSELEMLRFLHELKDVDVLQVYENVRERFFESFAFGLIEEVKQLKITVKLLLKEREHKPASITVGQLNDIHGGIRG